MVPRRCLSLRPPPWHSASASSRTAVLIQYRCYVQQRTARTAKTQPQQSTSKPSPTSRAKNRADAPSLTVPPAAAASTSIPKAADIDAKEADRLRRKSQMLSMQETGQQQDWIRLSVNRGIDPWRSKAEILDLCVPTPLTKVHKYVEEKSVRALASAYWEAIRENTNNNVQNVFSMFRLANDFAFTNVVTKWRFHPQLFMTKSTSKKAWVAGYREELLDVYKRVNESIASGDGKTLREVTAFDYREHALGLLKKSTARAPERTFTWSLHSLVSPVQILSLRAFPFYMAKDEPAYGNRNCVQLVARFETMQTLRVKNRMGQVLKPDRSVAEPGWEPEPKKVVEYLVFENKMFYRDGWYVRDQMFEGVKAKYKELVV